MNTNEADSGSTVAPPGLEGGMVRDSRPCVKCSYDLRGLPVSGACPECGAAVAESMQGILLRYSGREYLATVRRGHSLVLIGIGVTLGLGLLASVVMYFLAQHNLSARAAGNAEIPNSTLALIWGIAGLGGNIISFVGYLKATTPDALYVGVEKSDAARKIVRGAVVAQLALQVVSTIMELVRDGDGGNSGPAVKFFWFILPLARYGTWATQFFAMMAYEHWLGARISDRRVVRITKIYAWLLPGLMALGMMPWLLSGWLATRAVSGTGIGALIVVGAVSLISQIVAAVLYCMLLNRVRRALSGIELSLSGEPASPASAYG